MKKCWISIALLPSLLTAGSGMSGRALAAEDLVISRGGRTDAVVVVSPDAGEFERRAADDLAKYIGMMSGDQPTVASSEAAISAATQGTRPLLLVGQEALKRKPALKEAVNAVLKKDPHLRTDGIVLKREGNRIYLVGNNDRSHYFAVADLLRRWGCRWYMPTEFGECVPDRQELMIGELDHVYSSPFEIRTYWISWNGDRTGAEEFQLRNMMTDRSEMPRTGHALGRYTKGLGKGTFEFPITDPETAKHVARQVEEKYAAGESFSLGMEDGSYDSDYAKDQELMKLQWDKYFMRWSVTDPMLELYNNVARILQKKYPDSDAKIGFLAYANMTIPPVRDMTAERSLYCELAPIDIDPIHGMDDIESPPRHEFRDMMYEWAKVMDGRLAIYDYDQSMLVWRDIPNPSHQAFRQDVKHYEKAGILGVNTESRNAIATTFLNLYLRGRLLWNPDADLDTLLSELYPKFYGPAAEPMQRYWSAIYEAWENTICTEHEHFVIPAIYTPQLVSRLGQHLKDAEQIINGIKVQARQLTRNEQLYVRRMEFTRISYEILDAYTTMVAAGARNIDYDKAVVAGERGLTARDEMTALGGIFTTTRLEGNGPAWWPGEVQQYRDLRGVTNGDKGTLVAKLPLEWAFRRDPGNRGLSLGYAAKPVDLTYWKAHRDQLTPENRKDYPDEWEMIRTDLYAQAQGIRHPDRQSFTGHMWYRTDVNMTDKQLEGPLHLRFPGLFNECWLYVNGKEVAHREQRNIWWYNNYRFEWDVDLTGHLEAGDNAIALRCNCEHHLGGMFRRPFLYQVEPE